MDNATRLERLRLLKTVLGDVPIDHKGFDMDSWAQHGDPMGQTPENAPHLDGVLPGCGTACCALGYAALRPEFQALGLKITYDRDRYLRPVWSPLYEGRLDFAAGRALFGLEDGEELHLFAPTRYADPDPDTDPEDGQPELRITPAMVIARIDELIAKYEATS